MSFLKVNRERIIRALLWLIVLLPVVWSIALVRKNAVDQRFLDDLELTRYLIKFKEGTLKLDDLFAVYIEHRPAVSRLLSVASIIAGGGDVRAHNVIGILFLLTGFFVMARLWLKHGRVTIREAWLPLLISAVALFTPVQWQTLLWPDCFYSVIPGALLVLSIALSFSNRPWWFRCLIGTLYAVIGTLSFASGILLWILPLPVMLVCGSFGSARERIKFTALWFAVMSVVFALYLDLNVQRRDAVTEEQPLLNLPGDKVLTYDLRNDVPRQFAYGQEHDNTTANHTPYFLHNPAEAFDFVRAFCGVLLMRGAAADTKVASETAGSFVLAGLTLLAWFCWRYRKERELFRLLFAMLCFGAYTPVTGVLVAVGRLWAGHVHAALNVRYHSHHAQVFIALAGAALFIVRHRAAARPGERQVADGAIFWGLGGVLLGIMGLGWLYGANMMESWRSARLRNAAAQMLCPLFPQANWFVSYISGNYELTRDTVAALEKHGLIKTPLLHDSKLFSKYVHANERVLGPERAFVHRLWKENGVWKFDGYASIPRTERPADGVILAYRVAGGEWTIWGFTQGDGPPHYLPSAMGKDLWGIVPKDEQWPPEFRFPLADVPAIISEPPADAEISFWTLDMEHHQLFRIGADRLRKNDEPGESLQALSVHRDPVRGM